MKTFYDYTPILFKLNLMSNTFYLKKKKEFKYNKLYYKYYIKLIKQYKTLGILPLKINKFIKLNIK